jgi:hypothetical protein
MNPDHWHRNGGPGASSAVVDFKWLANLELPQLQNLMLTINFDHVFASDNNLMAVFDRAAIEFGLKLIGGNGVMTTTSTPPLAVTRTLAEMRLRIGYTFSRAEMYVTRIKKMAA